jgi:hypothetical protein
MIDIVDSILKSFEFHYLFRSKMLQLKFYIFMVVFLPVINNLKVFIFVLIIIFYHYAYQYLNG